MKRFSVRTCVRDLFASIRDSSAAARSTREGAGRMRVTWHSRSWRRKHAGWRERGGGHRSGLRDDRRGRQHADGECERHRGGYVD